jgi:hypothetical protein
MFALVGCGNYTMLDTTYTFDYAIIELPNGEIVEGEVEEWCDYEGEQLQVKMKNGDIYLTSTYHCTLIQTR